MLPQTGERILHALPWIGGLIILAVGCFYLYQKKFK